MPKAQAAASPARLSLPAALAFAAAYMPFAGIQLSVAVQLPPFFASQLGLGLAVGSAFGLVRLIDLFVDPVLGLLIDRTNTPIGRYRPWMIGGVPILMLALYMLFQAKPGIGFAYVVGWLLVMYLGMYILLLAGNAWAAALASTYQDRSRVFGAMAGIGVLSATSALLIPIIAVKYLHRPDAATPAVGWFMFALTPLAVGLAVLVTREPPPKPSHGGARYRLKDYATLLARPNVLRILAADFCITLGPGWMSALYYFFWTSSRQVSRPVADFLLILYIVAGLVGAPATAWLANRISKHRALIVSTTLYSLLLIIIPLTPKGLVWPSVPVMFLLGACAAGFVVTVRAITADVGDEIRLEGGQDQIGLLYALTSATTKLASAMSITFTFAALGMVGYHVKKGEVNGPAEVHGLEMIFIIGPIFFVMLGGASFLAYKLSAQRHADIRRELDERDAQYSEPAAVQSLTGDAGEATAPGA